MALPYTPGQSAVACVEEHDALAEELDGLPVVCCGLHSQLAPVVAGIGTGVRIAYVQLAGGALPVALSDTVRLLKTRQLLETAVAVAPCFDGDVQALSPASALAWAKAKGFDVVVCGIGPGIVGSGSALGHGGLAVSDAANAAAALGGRAIVVVRYSGRDPRERHGGVSHHTRSALRLILGDREVVWPAGLERDAELGDVIEVEVDGWREVCANLSLTHMGRHADDDPWFFAAAFAAGRHARAARLMRVRGDGAAAARAGHRPRDVQDLPRRRAPRRGGGRRRARRGHDGVRLVADVRRRRGVARERVARRAARDGVVATKIWADSVDEGKAQYAAQLRALRPGRDRADPQSRRPGASSFPGSRRERDAGRIDRLGVTHWDAGQLRRARAGACAPAGSTRCRSRSTRSSASARRGSCRSPRSSASR